MAAIGFARRKRQFALGPVDERLATGLLRHILRPADAPVAAPRLIG